jgi:hypothetical protein
MGRQPGPGYGVSRHPHDDYGYGPWGYWGEGTGCRWETYQENSWQRLGPKEVVWYTLPDGRKVSECEAAKYFVARNNTLARYRKQGKTPDQIVELLTGRKKIKGAMIKTVWYTLPDGQEVSEAKAAQYFNMTQSTLAEHRRNGKTPHQIIELLSKPGRAKGEKENTVWYTLPDGRKTSEAGAARYFGVRASSVNSHRKRGKTPEQIVAYYQAKAKAKTAADERRAA